MTVLGDWLSDRALSGSPSAAVASRRKDSRMMALRIVYRSAAYVFFAICVVVVFYWLEWPG